MTDKTRAAFEAIYGKRGVSSLAVASWDMRLQVWELSRKQAIEECIAAAENGVTMHCAEAPENIAYLKGISNTVNRLKELL